MDTFVPSIRTLFEGRNLLVKWFLHYCFYGVSIAIPFKFGTRDASDEVTFI